MSGNWVTRWVQAWESFGFVNLYEVEFTMNKILTLYARITAALLPNTFENNDCTHSLLKLEISIYKCNICHGLNISFFSNVGYNFHCLQVYWSSQQWVLE